eukprot:11476895-Karenia_brevis.AAC.1
MYAENFANSNEDIDGFRLLNGPDHVPVGVDRGQMYRFRDIPSGAALLQLRQEARVLAEGEAIRAGGALEEEGDWYSLDDAGLIKKGDKVTLAADAAVLGDKALMNVQVDGAISVISLERVQRRIVIDDDTDARVLPILRKGTERHRAFKDAAEKWERISFSDWKVPGPRTVSWCGRFLAKRGGPMAHHEWWRSVTRLGNGDYGVAEHEAVMRMLQEAVEYDQLDVVNLGCIEHSMRRAQLIEYYHREKTKQDAASKDRQ